MEVAGVGVAAGGELLALAELAVAAGNVEGNDDALAFVEGRDLRADLEKW